MGPVLAWPWHWPGPGLGPGPGPALALALARPWPGLFFLGEVDLVAWGGHSDTTLIFVFFKGRPWPAVGRLKQRGPPWPASPGAMALARPRPGPGPALALALAQAAARFKIPNDCAGSNAWAGKKIVLLMAQVLGLRMQDKSPRSFCFNQIHSVLLSAKNKRSLERKRQEEF